MSNFYDDNEDLRFYVEKGIDWEPIVRMTERDGKAPDAFASTSDAVAFYADVLRLIGGFAANEIAPIVLELDRSHPSLVDGEVVYPEVTTGMYGKLAALELPGMCIPRELGGMNCPTVLNMIQLELLGRADVSVSAHVGFHGGMALIALQYSILEGTTAYDEATGRITATRFSRMIEDIVKNGAWGSMDITEPSAGSDMGALRCKGEQDARGNWTVTGAKQFITSGHGKYHYVIARTEKPAEGGDAFAGLSGLSLFLVPSWSEGEDGARVRHVTVTALEQKLGHHGSATCMLDFDRAPAMLIGKRGEGFRNMLVLMNGARVAVGFECLGLCEAALHIARTYAAERVSMGRPLDRHEMIADYLDEAQTDVQAIRCMAMSAAVHVEMSQKIDAVLRLSPPADPSERERLEKDRKRHERRARHLTPLIKWLAAEKAVEITRRAVQILGGAGYMVEYGAEKLLRDAMVMPIYEGTSQIQALMAMKDNLLDAVRRPRSFLGRAAEDRWRSVSARDPLHKRVAGLQVIADRTLRALVSKLAATKIKDLRHRPIAQWASAFAAFDPKRDFALALLHAERLTAILADVAACEELLAQVRRHPERAHILERYLERAEPRCRYHHDRIAHSGADLLERLARAERPAEGAP